MPQACTWNIGVIGMYTSLVPSRRTLSMLPVTVGLGQGVQHQLAMGEVHALGVAGGAGGVEGGGHRVFVEIGKS
jgi:hypothetical protein